MGISKDAAGWTVVTPASDTKIAYVDDILGNDGTGVFYDWNASAIGVDPLNPIGPVNAFQTIQTGLDQLRDGFADWLLLKRGETFTDQQINLWGSGRTGRSSTEPIYMGAYGASMATARPLIKPNESYGINMYGCDGFIVIQSFDFYCYKHDPTNVSYTGVGGEGCVGSRATNELVQRDFVVIEDCKFSYFTMGIVFEIVTLTTPSSKNNTIRRCTIDHTYNPNAHSQGMFLAYIEDALVEECFFDRNGWYGTQESHRSASPVAGAEADSLSHNIYWSSYCPLGSGNISDNREKMKFVDNYTLNASGAGAQLRSGGTLTGNISYMDPYPFLLGGSSASFDGEWPEGLYGVMSDNYSEASNDINDSSAGGVAYRVRNTQLAYINRNIAKSPINAISSPDRFSIMSNTNGFPTTIQEMDGNVFNNATRGAPSGESDGINRLYGAVTNNDWWDAVNVPYPIEGSNRDGALVDYTDDTRTLATYATAVIGEASLDDFWNTRRNMHRGNWDTAYMTPTVLAWLQFGYDVIKPGLGIRGIVRVRAKAR